MGICTCDKWFMRPTLRGFLTIITSGIILLTIYFVRLEPTRLTNILKYALKDKLVVSPRERLNTGRQTEVSIRSLISIAEQQKPPRNTNVWIANTSFPAQSNGTSFQDTPAAPRSGNGSEAEVVPAVQPIVRHGRFRGQVSFLLQAYSRARRPQWNVDTRLVSQFCKDTNFTQCSPRPGRSDKEKVADRAARRPFNVVFYIGPKAFGTPDFKGCDYDNCRYSGRNVTQATDAVFVFGVGLGRTKKPVPKIRLPNQTFIFGAGETPVFKWSKLLTGKPSPWQHVFNATNTYRIDSDIPYPYGKLEFRPISKEKRSDYLRIFKRKKRTAVWFVSNCTPLRVLYVKEMQKYIDIDIFGKCGEACELNNGMCLSDFYETYKFYLAFENSFSSYYVTEKFFKLFTEGAHIIPVVRGALDYSGEFPNRTFVDAADFSGPRKLALFLKALGEDAEEYSRYLEVKDMYRAVGPVSRWCKLCEYMHKRPARRPAIDIREFYNQKQWDRHNNVTEMIKTFRT